jgi:hypothetical protein
MHNWYGENKQPKNFALILYFFHSEHSPNRRKFAQPAVDVMITIFGHFRLFSVKKIHVFLTNQCYDQILVKNANLLTNFLAKIFKNHRSQVTLLEMDAPEIQPDFFDSNNWTGVTECRRYS